MTVRGAACEADTFGNWRRRTFNRRGPCLRQSTEIPRGPKAWESELRLRI